MTWLISFVRGVVTILTSNRQTQADVMRIGGLVKVDRLEILVMICKWSDNSIVMDIE